MALQRELRTPIDSLRCKECQSPLIGDGSPEHPIRCPNQAAHDAAPPRAATLFEQFEARSRANPRSLLTDAACAYVTQGLSTLLALGYAPDQLTDFCEQSLKAAKGIAEQAKTEASTIPQDQTGNDGSESMHGAPSGQYDPPNEAT